MIHAVLRSIGSSARNIPDFLGANRDRPPPYVLAVFAEAEQRSEMLLAYLRLAVLVILLVVLRIFDFFGNHYVAILSIALYGIATGVALLLAWRRLYRPWLPWLFTTLDVALVIAFVAMLTEHVGLSTAMAFSTPGGLMIFLFLAHAAVRYRPALVLYTATLFLVSRVGFDLITITATPEPIRPEWTVTQEWAQIAVTLLTAATLYVTARRTRRLLLKAIQDSHLRTSISRFVPDELVDQLVHHGETAGPPRLKHAAVLFADIRGFTATSERMAPVEVLNFLNEYRGRMTAVVAAHGGTVDKFIGDAVMVVFGLRRSETADAPNALSCALAMLTAIETWNRERFTAGLEPVRMGIGAHYGELIIGAVGDEHRLEYTVIGDTVNTAQRIERLCAGLGRPLLVSAALLRAAGPQQARWEPVGMQSVQGREQLIEVFAPADHCKQLQALDYINDKGHRRGPQARSSR